MNAEKSKKSVLQILCACVAVSGIQLADTPTAHAEFYKCISSGGATSYEDRPCEADQSIHVLTKSARELPMLDCRIASNFSFDIVARMRHGDTAKEVFDAYGGADNLSADVRGLINNVFTFKERSAAGAQQIVDLTVQRCQSGLLGKKLNTCDVYPEEFIDRMGGCTGAKQVEETSLIQPQSAAALPVTNTPALLVETPDAEQMLVDDSENLDSPNGTDNLNSLDDSDSSEYLNGEQDMSELSNVNSLDTMSSQSETEN